MNLPIMECSLVPIKIEVLALDLIHHVLHLGKTHHAGDDVRADHEGGDIVGEAPVDHEIPGVGENGRVQPGDIALEVVKPVAAGSCGRCPDRRRPAAP